MRAGESAQFVDPAEIPADTDVAKLGQALAQGRRGDLYELMASTAAYGGLRQGDLFALTIGQIATAARVISVDRKVVDIGGKLYLEAPKGRKVAVSWTMHNPLLCDWARYGTYRGTQQSMNAALGGILRAFGYPVAPFGSGGAWLVTGHRSRETEPRR